MADRFMRDPAARRSPAAIICQATGGGGSMTIMPTQPDLNRTRPSPLLDLIAAESLLEASQFRGLADFDAPFTPPTSARPLFFRGETLSGTDRPVSVLQHRRSRLACGQPARTRPHLVFRTVEGRSLASGCSPGDPAMRTVFIKWSWRRTKSSRYRHFRNRRKSGGKPDTVAP